MDIKLKSDDYDFKFRIAGCLLVDDSILTVQMCNNGFYCFPGGHLQLGEDSKTAIIREFKEETKFDCHVEKLFAIVENFFKNNSGKLIHEVCFFYLLKSEGMKKNDFTLTENDENVLKNLEFKWYKLSELESVNFKPIILKDKLIKKDFTFEHIVLDQTKKI